MKAARAPARRRMLSALCLGALCGAAPAALAQGAKPAGRVVSWPEVTLLDGTRWGPAQAQGKTVIVVFWSTTCPFCLRHNAHIEKLPLFSVANRMNAYNTYVLMEQAK